MNKILNKLYEIYNIRDDSTKHPDSLPEITGKGGAPVVDISISPDGKLIASVDGRIHIWDYASGKKVRSFYSPSRLTSITFTPDSKFVVVGNVNGNLQKWNAQSGKVVREFLRN